jgi:hypothetical protein
MTTNEFREWTKVTEPRMKWTTDQFRWHDNGEMLFYLGDEKGKFICLYSNGRIQTGTYEGAVPHIAGACFQAAFEKAFDSPQEAFARVVEIGGGQFLRSWRRVAFEVEKTMKLYALTEQVEALENR